VLHASSEIPLIVVPDQSVCRRAVREILRQANRGAVQCVVVASVLELFFDPAADFEVGLLAVFSG
jgi:hypothetical protein